MKKMEQQKQRRQNSVPAGDKPRSPKAAAPAKMPPAKTWLGFMLIFTNIICATLDLRLT